MQSKYFAHQTPQSKTIFVVLEILKAVPPYGSRTAKKKKEREKEIDIVEVNYTDRNKLVNCYSS